VLGAVEVKVVVQEATGHRGGAVRAWDRDMVALGGEVVGQKALRERLRAGRAGYLEVLTVQQVLLQE